MGKVSLREEEGRAFQVEGLTYTKALGRKENDALGKLKKACVIASNNSPKSLILGFWRLCFSNQNQDSLEKWPVPGLERESTSWSSNTLLSESNKVLKE